MAEDYELSAEEASDLIAALGGTSQQRAGYREHLGGELVGGFGQRPWAKVDLW